MRISMKHTKAVTNILCLCFYSRLHACFIENKVNVPLFQLCSYSILYLCMYKLNELINFFFRNVLLFLREELYVKCNNNIQTKAVINSLNAFYIYLYLYVQVSPKRFYVF